MVRVVIFDLGNTLISYYTREMFTDILSEAVNNCTEYLRKEGLLNISLEKIEEQVHANNHGSPGNKVYPMEQRLSTIYDINDPDKLYELCKIFMEPILATSRLYDDVLPVLRELKRRGFIVAVLSNTPWGCPSSIWKTELTRYGLSEYIDAAVCCYDVGWRKPDPRPFKYLLEMLKAQPEECLFVGDDPRWDIEGPKALGMKTLLIDRTKCNPDAAHGLDEVLEILVEDVLRE